MLRMFYECFLGRVGRHFLCKMTILGPKSGQNSSFWKRSKMAWKRFKMVRERERTQQRRVPECQELILGLRWPVLYGQPSEFCIPANSAKVHCAHGIPQAVSKCGMCSPQWAPPFKSQTSCIHTTYPPHMILRGWRVGLDVDGPTLARGSLWLRFFGWAAGYGRVFGGTAVPAVGSICKAFGPLPCQTQPASAYVLHLLCVFTHFCITLGIVKGITP